MLMVQYTENVEQWNGATYGRHIWGDDNTVDVYKWHTHNLDIHVDGVVRNQSIWKWQSHTYTFIKVQTIQNLL